MNNEYCLENGDENSMIIVASNEKEAEDYARYLGFKYAELEIEQIDLSKKHVAFITHFSANDETGNWESSKEVENEDMEEGRFKKAFLEFIKEGEDFNL